MTGFILLASYPKSGNTWLRALLTSLRQGGAPVDINSLGIKSAAQRGVLDDALGVETSDLLPEEIARLLPAAYDILLREKQASLELKIHDAWLPAPGAAVPPLPRDAVRAAIYLTRDPRDVAVSFAQHLGRAIDAAIDHMADAAFTLARSQQSLRPQMQQYLSSWSGHVDSWLQSGLPLHWIRYEDLVRAPLATLGALARFLGLPDDAEILIRALQAASFEKLQSDETEQGFREASHKSSEPFFRRGIVGGWRETLTSPQAERIVVDHGVVMRRLGYAT